MVVTWVPAAGGWYASTTVEASHDEGYDVAVIQLSSGNHPAPIFHDGRDGQWQVLTDDPAGEQAVEIILDAITAAGGTTSG